MYLNVPQRFRLYTKAAPGSSPTSKELSIQANKAHRTLPAKSDVCTQHAFERRQAPWDTLDGDGVTCVAHLIDHLQHPPSVAQGIRLATWYAGPGSEGCGECEDVCAEAAGACGKE